MTAFADHDDHSNEPATEPEPRYLFRPGGSFILDVDPDPVAVWGAGSEVLAARGEALMIAGPQGVGKTTLGQQYALGRCGFDEYVKLLGYPILPGSKRTLYLAMDRPQQAARSMRRMVGEAWRHELDDRLAVWPGPPPHDLGKYPWLLRDLCEQAGADTVIVDSLKDAFIGLTDDEAAAGWNRARQTAIADGVEVLELQHLRKNPNGIKSAGPTMDDVYGSTWLTSGCGSVVLLTGAPGDPIVGLHHLKQPADPVGPLKVIHDADAGRSEVWHATDLATVALATPGGITALDAARVLFDTDKPDLSQKEKARRRLLKLPGIRIVDPGDKAMNRPTRWGA
ncbi:AAA family ATPase [Nocardioides luteus]|uniref:AAA family ATPase n=1 Tax=Nocardioides luteus TaxID=1844 RepID=UPI0018C96FB0|nr:AAA family ATPase [Nocardioides luteus]MBG6095954.1 replicative DNA helicase [Nocardioides luteus]